MTGAINQLRAHRYIVRAALAAANLFGWIFIFDFFANSQGIGSQAVGPALVATALLYSVSQDVVLFATPASAAALSHGTVRLMTTALIVAAVAYILLALALMGVTGQLLMASLVVFALLRGMYRALYWVPYSVELPHARSRIAQHAPEVLVALVPAFAGLILTSGMTGVKTVLFGAAALLLISIAPLIRAGSVREKFSWGYLETFKQLVSPRHRVLAKTSFLDGMTGAGIFLFWPIAIFLIIGQSYAMLGIVISVTYLLVFASKDYVHSLMRRVRIDDSPLVHAALAASSWVFRLTVSTPLGIVLVDSYYYSGAPVRGSGIDRLSFDQAADKGTFIDEYTALKEMALAAGKIAICLMGVLLAAYISLAATFLAVFMLAALASAGSVYLTRTAK